MTVTTPASARLRRLYSEPFLHFLLLGTLLFIVDSSLFGQSDDPRVIRVDASTAKELEQVFINERGRKPDTKEMEALKERWIYNEILYREGLAQQLDKGDKTIQDRVIFKMLSVLEAGLKAPVASDETLLEFFQANRERYDEPERMDFEEAVLLDGTGEVAIRKFVGTLNAGHDAKVEANLRVFKARPVPTIEQGYGKDVMRQLRAAVPGVWVELETRDGWRAFKLLAIQPARPAEFHAVRPAVHQQWLDSTMASMRTRAVESLGRKYDIRGWERVQP